MSAADVQKQYKSYQCKDKVITQISVPEEHEPELMHHINLVLLGNQSVSVPTRSFVLSSYLQGGTSVSFLVLERLTTLSEYCSAVDRAAEHLPVAPMGSDLFCGWAGWMPVLSIWPLVEDQYDAVLFHLASPGRKLFITISPFGGDQFDKREVRI